jgi:hypothetical protein
MRCGEDNPCCWYVREKEIKIMWMSVVCAHQKYLFYSIRVLTIPECKNVSLVYWVLFPADKP